MIGIDLNGRTVELGRADLERLRDAALADAASSSPRRDLGFVLTQALNKGKMTTLRRAEVRELGRLAAEQQLAHLLESTR
jgi:hypothetical protein